MTQLIDVLFTLFHAIFISPFELRQTLELTLCFLTYGFSHKETDIIDSVHLVDLQPLRAFLAALTC